MQLVIEMKFVSHTYYRLSMSGEIFQQDNARPHAARLTMDYLQNQNITVIPWPSKWSDLNPIEHLWDELDRRVRQRQPQTLQALQQALQYEWQRIPQERIHGLIGSMSRRVRTFLQVNGGHNRYWIWRCNYERLKPCVPLFFQCNKQKHVDNHCANFPFDIFHFSVLNCILKCMKYMLNFPMLRFFFLQFIYLKSLSNL